MSKHLSLRIDTPCSQSWADMAHHEQGRFCNACQKNVVDFTAMSDNELIAWFAAKSGDPNTCGRLTPTQIDRLLIPQRKPLFTPSALWRYLIAGIFITTEATTEATAQAQSATPATSQHDSTQSPKKQTNINTPTQSLTTITGFIRDEDGNPIQDASIMIIGTSKGTRSDINGQFSLNLGSLGNPIQIKISYIGYVSQITPINDKWYNQQPVILMRQTATLGLVGIVVSHRKHKPMPSLFTKIKDTLASCTGMSKKTLSVYPNPVSRGTSVNLSLNLDQFGTYTAQLFNINGALLESMEIEGGQQEKHVLMDIPSTLAPGNYFVRLSHPSLKKPFSQQIAVF